MNISYPSITSSFDGRGGLEKLQVRIPALSDGVSIEQIELKFRSLGGLLRFGERLVERKPGACVPGSGVTARGSSNRVRGDSVITADSRAD
ncbi:hypothetical protein [Zestomonas thermotolerans]|uniref:hypothetical protein n=1 Tax=Zestomonas thermotolerans TaxID=157784 RepID=UPI0023F1C307|nr:hypothetical protein [Pseudomonas thermotolerans]